MSRIFKIHTSRILPVFELVEKLRGLSDYRHTCLFVRHPTCYFFDYASLRGVDVTQMQGYIEVRLPFLANSGAYLLAGLIMNTLHKLTSGDVRDEHGAYKIGNRIWDGDIINYQKHDLDVLKALLSKDRELTLYGPFGPYEVENAEIKKILEGRDGVHAKMWRIAGTLKQQCPKEFESIFPG